MRRTPGGSGIRRIGSVGGSFFYNAVAEGIEEFHQFVDLRLEFAPFVGVAHSHAMAAQLDDLGRADDVCSVDDRVFG